MKRREFLEKTLAGLGVAALPNLISPLMAAETLDQAAVVASDFSTDPVATVALTPQIKTSRVGLGTGVHGGNRQCNLTRMNREKAVDIIRYCYDCGIRFFDLADMYGTHQLVAGALANKPRDQMTLSTKIWCHPGGVPEKERPLADVLVERFLRELHTDYIDMVQLHCIFNTRWTTDLAHQMEMLEKLKERGLIRAHGISCHSLAAAKQAAELPWIDAFHIRINNANMRMDGTWDETADVTRLAKKNGKGLVAMKVLGEGGIKTPEGRRASTEAVVRLGTIDTMIVGFEERAHVDEFLLNVENTLKAMKAEASV
ncbi:MAG: aldo/keto reductase [Planctomycetia bacterium]|nr:aldo/keto reductase [Planctomycetia bacterium]